MGGGGGSTLRKLSDSAFRLFLAHGTFVVSCIRVVPYHLYQGCPGGGTDGTCWPVPPAVFEPNLQSVHPDDVSHTNDINCLSLNLSVILGPQPVFARRQRIQNTFLYFNNY